MIEVVDNQVEYWYNGARISLITHNQQCLRLSTQVGGDSQVLEINLNQGPEGLYPMSIKYLALFAQNLGMPVTYNDIRDTLYDGYIENPTIRVHAATLRKQLTGHIGGIEILYSKHARGYSLGAVPPTHIIHNKENGNGVHVRGLNLDTGGTYIIDADRNYHYTGFFTENQHKIIQSIMGRGSVELNDLLQGITEDGKVLNSDTQTLRVQISQINKKFGCDLVTRIGAGTYALNDLLKQNC